MSKVTELLNRSTSMATDVVLAVAIGGLAGLGADWVQLDATPLIGAYVPPACAAAVAWLVLDRQRRLVRSPAATFT